MIIGRLLSFPARRRNRQLNHVSAARYLFVLSTCRRTVIHAESFEFWCISCCGSSLVCHCTCSVDFLERRSERCRVGCTCKILFIQLPQISISVALATSISTYACYNTEMSCGFCSPDKIPVCYHPRPTRRAAYCVRRVCLWAFVCLLRFTP